NLGWFIVTGEPPYYTLSGVTDAYFEAVNPDGKEVEVLFCMSEREMEDTPTYGRILDTVKQYAERYDFISYRHLNVRLDYEDLAGYAEEHDTTVTSSTVIVACPDTGESIIRALSTFYVFDSENEEAEDMVYNGEEIVATMVGRVMGGERPTAVFTTGHGERPTQSLMNHLYSAGYDIVTADISREGIDEKCELLVVAAPLYDFEEYADKSLVSEISRMRDYLSDGGNILVLRSPTAGGLARLDSFLASYGLVTEETGLVKDSAASVDVSGTALLVQGATGEGESLLSTLKEVSGAPIVMGDCGKITVTEGAGFTAYPLLNTSSSAKEYAGGAQVSVAPEGGYTVAAVSEWLAKTGDTGKLLLLNASVFSERILLDSDGYANESLLYVFTEYAVGMPTPKGCGTLLINTYPLEGMNRGVAGLWLAILGGAAPLAVAVTGVYVTLRRRQGKKRTR
ncbi:MAG: Gldg family protein, partial [Clostridia bacterium]|nr:Gldg family protein [Clostridia bacterium]